MLKADHFTLAHRPDGADGVVEGDEGDAKKGQRGENGKRRSRTYQDQTLDHPFRSFSSLDKRVS